MKRLLFTLSFLIAALISYAQSPTQWTINLTPAQVRNAFNNNFTYLYSNKGDKTNPVIIGIIKISNGTAVTDTVATLDDLRTQGGGTGGSMTYPGAGIPVSNATAWGTSITNNSGNWNTAYTDRYKWDGGNSGLTPATGRISLGATTVGSSFFTLTNPGAITFPRINADNTVTALSAANMKTALGIVDGSDASVRAIVADSLNALRTGAAQVSTVALLIEDSARYATDYRVDLIEAALANTVLIGDTTTATVGTMKVGRIVFKTSDSHFYGCRKLTTKKWYQLDNLSGSTTSTLLDGLLAGWKLDESNGNALDVLSVNTGVSSNITYNVAGKIGNSFTFDGSTSHVSLGNVLKPTSAISISAWIKTSSATAQNILSSLIYGTGWQGYSLTVASDGALGLTLGTNTASSFDGAYNPIENNLVDGAWHHVVITWDGTSVYFYIDNSSSTASAWSSPIVYSGSSSLYIGRATGGSNRFNGSIDMVWVYNRALTVSEVNELYTKESTGTTYPW